MFKKNLYNHSTKNQTTYKQDRNKLNLVIRLSKKQLINCFNVTIYLRVNAVEHGKQ